MSERRKTLLLYFCSFWLYLLSLFITGEFILRVFHIDPPMKTFRGPDFFVEHDALLGWKKIPNKRGQLVAEEYTTSERLNSKGLRGPEYSYKKTTNEYRILALGDSFTEGYTVDFDQVFSEVLKRRLNHKKDRYYEVINAGTFAYGTDQEYLFFKEEGKKYHPDLTILMFFANDVWDNYKDKEGDWCKPRFKVGKDDQLILTNVPCPKPEILPSPPRPTIVGTSRSPLLPRTKDWLAAQFWVYRFITDTIRNTYVHDLAVRIRLAEEPAPKEPPQTPIQITRAVVPISEEYRVWEKTYNSQVREGWKITEAIINELKNETTSLGSNFLVFYINPQRSIYDEIWEDFKSQFGITDEDWNRDQVKIELEGACNRNHIDFIDSTEQFRIAASRLTQEHGRLYFLKDAHWNANGHKLAGELLAEYIDSHYLNLIGVK